MTISETLVAACLFFGALGGSLQVWGLTAATAVAEEKRQESREQVDAEMAASEARLRVHARGREPSADCVAQAQALRETLAAQPPAPGLQRSLASLEGGLVQITVAAEGEVEPPRQRIWSAAAFGLCQPAPPPPAPLP
jgi:hypothetical protein